MTATAWRTATVLHAATTMLGLLTMVHERGSLNLAEWLRYPLLRSGNLRFVHGRYIRQGMNLV